MTKLRSLPTSVWLSLIVLGLFIMGGIMAQQQVPGTNVVTANAGANLNTSALALESGGNLSMLAGAVSASKLNINISSGSIGNTAFGVSAGTALIGTVLPKTACGTTYYDSGPVNLPASIASVTATPTCVEAIYCASLDATTAHPLTGTDGSVACNAGTCNLIPPGYSLQPLAQIRFPMGFVRAVGGVRWNTDAINKVTCWVEGLQ